MIIASLATMTLLTGCPGKSPSGAPRINNGLGCVNCLQNTLQAQFGSTISSQIPQASLTMAFTGDAQQLNYWSSQGQNPIFTYQGQVGLTATLNVGTELYMGACRVPVGTYQTIAHVAQPGVQSNGAYSMGVFQFSRIDMVGQVNMSFAITDGVILTDGLGNIRSFSGLLVALTGVPALQTWGGFNPAMNGSIACGDSVGVRF